MLFCSLHRKDDETVNRWLLGGLKWGVGIGIIGMILLLLIGDLPLVEAPIFVSVWIALGLFIGFLMGRNEEQDKLARVVAINRKPDTTPVIAPKVR
jgi:hydrogenase/urease accessory protein HupE